MNTVLPLFVAGADFWKAPERAAYLAASLAGLLPGTGTGRHFVVTDDPDAAAAATAAGWEVVRVPRPAATPDPAPFFAPIAEPVEHLREALAAALAAGLPADAPVLVADCRNPHLDAALVAEARRRYRGNGGDALISVGRPGDHPCQFKSHLRLLDSGVLLFPAGDAADGSRPFAWDWDRQAPGEDAADFVFDRRRRVLRPAEDGETPRLSRGPGGSARVCGRSGDGVLRFPPAEATERAIRPASSDGGPAVRVPEGGDGVELARLLPFGTDGPLRSGRRELLLLPSCAAQILPLPGEAAGVVFFHFAFVEGDGGYDAAVSFAPEGAPWTVSLENPARRINLETGEVIHGRQAFPTVFQANGALCVLAAPGDAERCLDRAAPFEMDGRSLILRDAVDWLQYRIAKGERP